MQVSKARLWSNSEASMQVGWLLRHRRNLNISKRLRVCGLLKAIVAHIDGVIYGGSSDFSRRPTPSTASATPAGIGMNLPCSATPRVTGVSDLHAAVLYGHLTRQLDQSMSYAPRDSKS